MIDFTHAVGSKNHRSSFESAANEILLRVDELKDKYIETHEKLEVVRKKRASIIEEMVAIMKNNHVKLLKPLGRCNHKELNEVVTEALSSGRLSNSDKEIVQNMLFDANDLFDEMLPLSETLEGYALDLSNYRVEEKDAKNEVVVDLLKYKKNKDKKNVVEIETTVKESIQTQDDREEVIRVSKANVELVTSLNDFIGSKEKEELEIDDFDKITPSFISKDRMVEFYDRIENTMKVEEPKDDRVSFTIDDALTLQEISENVYGNKDSWIELYEFDNNKSIIDTRLEETGLTIGEAAVTPGVLGGLELEFPLELSREEKAKKLVA